MVLLSEGDASLSTCSRLIYGLLFSLTLMPFLFYESPTCLQSRKVVDLQSQLQEGR